jgi:hypothetical protein
LGPIRQRRRRTEGAAASEREGLSLGSVLKKRRKKMRKKKHKKLLKKTRWERLHKK